MCESGKGDNDAGYVGVVGVVGVGGVEGRASVTSENWPERLTGLCEVGGRANSTRAEGGELERSWTGWEMDRGRATTAEGPRESRGWVSDDSRICVGRRVHSPPSS